MNSQALLAKESITSRTKAYRLDISAIFGAAFAGSVDVHVRGVLVDTYPIHTFDHYSGIKVKYLSLMYDMYTLMAT